MKKLLAIILIVGLCFAFAACGTTAEDMTNDTEDIVDDATDAGEDVVDDATDAGEDVIDDATDAGKDVIDDVTDNNGNTTESTAASISNSADCVTLFNELNTAVDDLSTRIGKAVVPTDESAAQKAYDDYVSEIQALSATLDKLGDIAVNNEENGILSDEEAASLLDALDGTKANLDKIEQRLDEKFNQN
jgi:predicted  nucleic acid-binding Zn-ribbon protein